MRDADTLLDWSLGPRVSIGPTQTVSLRRLIPPLERKVGMDGGSCGCEPGELGTRVISW